MTEEARRWSTTELLLRVAWYYYKDELTQDEIARRLSVSRASVGRMLDRARKEGLVSISLNVDHLASFELSAALRERFRLAVALVIPGADASDQLSVNASLGVGGAQYLTTRVPAGSGLGVGWGDTVSRVVAAIDLSVIGALHAVTLTGGVDGYLQALAYSRGDRERLTASVIPSPIVASTPALAAALRAEPTIRRVIESARSLPFAVVGVGTPDADATLVRMGYLTAKDSRALARRGIVGDIRGQFFDADGQLVDLPLHERRIGVELADLRRIGRVVGIAGGPAKIAAISGALRGGHLDVLVTDESVATALLAD